MKVWYLGEADRFKFLSSISGNLYVWSKKDKINPVFVEVLDGDVDEILALRGRGCARRKPETVFMTDSEYQKEFGK